MFHRVFIHVILIVKGIFANVEVLLDGSNGATSISFRSPSRCGLVHPYGNSGEEERELTSHYLRHSSRVSLSSHSPSFRIKYPTYQEALLWSCCSVYPGTNEEGVCKAELNHSKAVASFSPVKVSKVVQVYHRNGDVPELTALMVEAQLPRPLHPHGESPKESKVQIVLDVDPASCNHRYTKRFTYNLLSKSRPDRNGFKVFTFSDSSLPKDCNVYLYLQKSCQFNTGECKVLIDGDTYYSHSESDNISQFKALNFTTTYDPNEENHVLIANGQEVDGKGLSVLHPEEDQFPLPAEISFFISSGNITAKLPQVAPYQLSGKLSGNKAVCDAKGNPKPTMTLVTADNDGKPCVQYESCGWDCRRCAWSVSQSALVRGKVSCRAANPIATAETQLLPAVGHIERIRLEPARQTVSIYGEMGNDTSHTAGAIHLNARVTIANWEDKKNVLVEKRQRERNRRAKSFQFRRDRLDEFKKLLLDEVRFLKRGLGDQPFACGRKQYNVELHPNCLTSNKCDATIQLVILFPEKKDEGAYGVELKPQGKVIFGTTEVTVSTERTAFIDAINTTQKGETQYNKFTIDKCFAENGETAYCRWWPMWRQNEQTTIYSVSFINVEHCDDSLSPNNTIVNDYIGDRPPKPLAVVTRGLIPGAKYKIIICTWEETEETRDDSSSMPGIRQVLVSGFGRRFCLEYAREDEHGNRVTHLQMPLEAPRTFPPRPTATHGPGLVEFTYPASNFAERKTVEGFDVIYRLFSDPTKPPKFTECENCPRLRFIAHGNGNKVTVGNIPAVAKMRPFFRWTNRMGVGPYEDTMRGTDGRRGYYGDVQIEQDDAMRRFATVRIEEVRLVDESFVDFVVRSEDVPISNELQLLVQKDEDVYTMRPAEKCSPTSMSDQVTCRLPVTEGTDRLVILLESGVRLMTVAFAPQKGLEGTTIDAPLLTYVNRSRNDVDVRFVPRMRMFESGREAVPRYQAIITYADRRHHAVFRDDSQRNFQRTIDLPVTSNVDEVRFVYRLSKCQVMYERKYLIPDSPDCPSLSDVTIEIQQSFKIDNQILSSGLTIAILLEPSPVYQSPSTVKSEIARYPVPKVLVTPMLYQPNNVFVDVSNFHVAMWYESELQFQILQKRRGYACSEHQAFEMRETTESDPTPLDDRHGRFEYFTQKWSIPRQRYDPFSEIDFSQDLKTYSEVEGGIRWLGGLDGFKDHCAPFMQSCIRKIDESFHLSDKFYKSNGYCSLPDNPTDRSVVSKCNYCFRSRVVFKGDDTFGDCGDKGCAGQWSSGEEFVNPEDRECRWEPQFDGRFLEPVPTSNVPQQNPTEEPERLAEPSLPDEGNMQFVVCAIVVVVLAFITLIAGGVFCCKYCKKSKAEYGRYPGTPGQLSDRYQETIQDYDTGGSSKPSRSNSPTQHGYHIQCNPPTDEFCAFVSRPGLSHRP